MWQAKNLTRGIGAYWLNTAAEAPGDVKVEYLAYLEFFAEGHKYLVS
jgi:hypothetical protein